MTPCGKDFNTHIFFPKKKLNLGCGHDYREGWVNVDILETVKADGYQDFNVYPYAFKENTFDEVYMSMVLEHADNPTRMLKEVIRICKTGAKVTVIVPHAFSYANVTDMQHKTNFTERTFQNELLEEYDLTELKLINQRFIYKTWWKAYLPFKGVLKLFFNGIYDDLEFTFKVIK